MATGEQARYNVIADTHGQYEKVAPVIDTLEPGTDVFLFLGDVLNGPDTAKLVGLIRDLGDRAVTLTGNHEWIYRNALSLEDDPAVEVWRDEVWPGYERGTLESYGLRYGHDWAGNAAELREAMRETGDLEWLNGLPPFVETDDFVAVHAGPEHEVPWQRQAAELRAAASPVARLTEEPPQIFSRELARDIDVSPVVDERVFVTGHAHLRLPLRDRFGQRRVRLASNLAAGDPLYVWDSATQTVTAHE
jgi:hypothetical protein